MMSYIFGSSVVSLVSVVDSVMDDAADPFTELSVCPDVETEELHADSNIVVIRSPDKSDLFIFISFECYLDSKK